MTDRCQWVESRLEAYFSDRMEAAEKKRLEQHVDGCAACRAEIDGFAKVDALVATHFRQRLQRAENPVRATVQPLRLAGALATVAVALVAVWFGIGTLDEAADKPAPATATLGTVTPDRGVEEVEKAGDPTDAELAKPDRAPDRPVILPVDRAPAMAGPATTESRFYVQDGAGYFHTLADFSGSVLVLGIVNEDPTAAAAFEQAYERYSSEVDLRFLGIPGEGATLEAARFPTMVNRESTLLETRPGEFAIVSPEGSVHARGTLSAAELQSAIDESLVRLVGKAPGDD